MCGIVGARTRPGENRPAPERRDAALRALAWRGRDGVGESSAGGWWIACARLAITDRAADQPIVDGPVSAVWNGYQPAAVALREQLAANGHRFSTANDAELVVAQTLVSDAPSASDAEAGVSTGEGHHAFAVVDERRTPLDRGLWLGRDPCGQKPLWVARDRDGQLLAFASTLESLTAVLGLSATPDSLPEAARRRWFRFGHHGPLSLDATGGVQVAELPPGLWTTGAGTGQLERHGPAPTPWSVPPGHRPTNLRAALSASVHAAVDLADVPVGLCLSGGLDSSCLAVALGDAPEYGRRHVARSAPAPSTDANGSEPRRCSAWSFRADGEPGDERECARDVANRAGLVLEEVDGDARILDALPRLTEAHGLPLGDPSVLALHAIARTAHERAGVAVLVSGEGADEVFAGYARQRAATVLGALAPFARAFARIFGRPDPSSVSRRQRLLRSASATAPQERIEALHEVVAPAVLETLFAVGGGTGDVRHDDTPTEGAGRRRTADGGKAGRLDAVCGDHVSHEPTPNDGPLAVDRGVYLPRDLLVKADVATLTAGVEARLPYLDTAVRAFAVRRTTWFGSQKQPLRRAFARDLPRSVLSARKHGLAIPLDRWLRSDRPNLLLDVLSDRRTAARPHLADGGLADVLDRHRSGRIDAGHALYLVAAFELWLRVRAAATTPAEHSA